MGCKPIPECHCRVVAVLTLTLDVNWPFKSIDICSTVPENLGLNGSALLNCRIVLLTLRHPSVAQQ